MTAETPVIFHPLHGHELDANDLEELVEQERRVDGYLRTLRRHYEFRDALRERIAELMGIRLPSRRINRTETQERVHRCPRCGEEERHA